MFLNKVSDTHECGVRLQDANAMASCALHAHIPSLPTSLHQFVLSSSWPQHSSYAPATVSNLVSNSLFFCTNLFKTLSPEKLPILFISTYHTNISAMGKRLCKLLKETQSRVREFLFLKCLKYKEGSIIYLQKDNLQHTVLNNAKKRFIGFHVKKCWLLCGLVLERVESERKWHSRKLVPDSVQSHLYSSSETLCSHYPSIPPSPTTLTNNLSPEDHGAFWTLIFGHAIMLFLTTRKAFCTLELIPT